MLDSVVAQDVNKPELPQVRHEDWQCRVELEERLGHAMIHPALSTKHSGDSRSDLADRVRDAFNELSRGRATVIAQTETGSAYGQGRQDVMVASGVEWKQWLSAEDDKVRPDHAEADGQAVPVDEPFDVGGEELMHPGDPDGSAEQVINCRCVAIAVQAPDDEEGE